MGREPLTSAEKRALKAKAQSLKPCVQIGKAGVTEGVISQIRAAFAKTELLKIRLPREVESVEDVVITILSQVPCELVELRGRVVLVYCARPGS